MTLATIQEVSPALYLCVWIKPGGICGFTHCNTTDGALHLGGQSAHCTLQKHQLTNILPQGWSLTHLRLWYLCIWWLGGRKIEGGNGKKTSKPQVICNWPFPGSFSLCVPLPGNLGLIGRQSGEKNGTCEAEAVIGGLILAAANQRRVMLWPVGIGWLIRQARMWSEWL